MGSISMGGFTKLFSRILVSSVWSESNETRIVWITLLALTGPDGIAKITIPGLSRLAAIAMPETKEALRVLSSPDAYSRTVENEGRRIKEVRDDAGNLVGFFLHNYAKHRAVDATSAERQKRFRLNRNSNARQKSEEQKTETSTSTDLVAPAGAQDVFDYWASKTNHRSSKFTPKRRRLVQMRLKEYGADRLLAAIDGCVLSPFHQGENDRHKRFDDIALICRDGEHVEDFERIAKEGLTDGPKRKTLADHNRAVLQQAIDSGQVDAALGPRRLSK